MGKRKSKASGGGGGSSSSSSVWSSLPWEKASTNGNGDAADNHREAAPNSSSSNNKSASSSAQRPGDDLGYNHYDDPDTTDARFEGELFDADGDGGKKKKKKGVGRRRPMPRSAAAGAAVVDGADDPGILFGFEVVDASHFVVTREKVAGGEVSRVVPVTRDREDDHMGDNDDDGGKNEPRGAAPEKKRKKQDQPTQTKQSKKDTPRRAADANDDDGNSSDEDDGGDMGDAKANATVEEEEAEIRRLKKRLKRREAKLRKKKRRQEEAEKQKEQQQQQQKQQQQAAPDAHGGSNGDDDGDVSDAQGPTLQEIDAVRTNWSVSAPGVCLHETLCRGLARQGFATPMPIQSSTLPASILGRRDIVGAAPTGSGKTLAYALPMLQGILTGRDERNDAVGGDTDEAEEEETTTKKSARSSADRRREPLTGLVLCPTRELAVQVSSEIQKVCCDEVGVGTIVGGLAEQKQKRVLNVKRPPILVATPGRLWELMSSEDHPHLMDLTKLRYLAVDEADRMIKQGSFPQLTQIFSLINDANPSPLEDGGDDVDDDDDDPDRLQSLPGIRGEAKVTMLDDRLMAMIRRQEEGGGGGDDGFEPNNIPADDSDSDEDDGNDEDSADESEEEEEERVHRQTFIFSATLTLPTSSHRLIKAAESSNKNTKKKRKKKGQSVDGLIAEILEKAGGCGQTKVVDLSTSANDKTDPGDTEKNKKDTSADKKRKDTASSKSPQGVKLPPGLSLYQVKCTQMHKDMHLYAYLTTTQMGSSGPCLVFCNSIAAVRRIGDTLKILGLPVRMLHAQMAQKQRMSALESLRKSKSRSIVVATDVAARGLDVSSITSVVHYDVPRAIDTFVHRAGRTARGVGETAFGSSISLVSAAEEKSQRAICQAVDSDTKEFKPLPLDGRLLSAAKERTSLAAQIVECESIESKASKQNKWFAKAAEDAGLDLDEDLLEGGLMDGDHRDRQRLAEAQKGRQRLKQLLAVPMRKQNFGKFLSGPGLKSAIRAESDVTPYVVNESGSGGPKKKRRKGR